MIFCALFYGRGMAHNISYFSHDDGFLVTIFSLTGSNVSGENLVVGRNGVKRLQTVSLFENDYLEHYGLLCST